VFRWPGFAYGYYKDIFSDIMKWKDRWESDYEETLWFIEFGNMDGYKEYETEL